MFDVFISHSSADAPIAFSICEFLEKAGLQCWIAPRNVQGGKRYSEEIMDGINDSQVFLLLYSSASNTSKHVISELDVAFNSEKVIIPFCLDTEKMSKEFSYYLAATHRIIGYPKPKERYEELKENIISNIPALASVREHDRMWDNVAKELGLTVEELRKYNSKVANLEEPGDAKGQRSRYDVLQNDNGEVLLIIQQRKGPATNPLFVLDSITKYALLYRSHESTVFFDDLAREANEAIRKVGEIQVVEITDDDVVREYKAPVRVVQDVRSLMDDPIPDNENDLLENIEPTKPEGFADVISSPKNDIMIVYEGDEIDDNAVFLFQNTGDNILFPTESFFIVPSKISKTCVTHLDEDGKVYVHCFKKTLAEPDEKERERIASAIDQWEKDGKVLPPYTIEVKSFHITSLLLFLSQMWGGGAGREEG